MTGTTSTNAAPAVIDVNKIQPLLRAQGLNGWLFSDFHGHDFITRDFLKLTSRCCTRRMYYLIPAAGEPVKLLSSIEPLLLDHLPGRKVLYQGIRGQTEALQTLFSELGETELKTPSPEEPAVPAANLPRAPRIAVQYSPGGHVPVASSMDGGLADYLKSFGVELVSSADLLQHFGAVLTEAQIESHKAAGVIIHRILDNTFAWIRRNLDDGTAINEWDLLQEMERLIAAEPIYMDAPPFFGIDEHGCDPGYEPKETGSKQIREGSRLIIDIAGRLQSEDAIYYDISWCMNVGPEIDPEYQRLFDLVQEARMLALTYVKENLPPSRQACVPEVTLRGCDVDARLRRFFEEKGMARYLMHRTGHNIGHSCHGIGANLDDFETHDTRRLLPGTMFSVEPGLYTETYGVRLEFDVHITKDCEVKIYGPVQDQILVI